jgi:hypothetical protein
MMREHHVRFCESAAVQSRRATHLRVGVIGSKADAREIMADIQKFLGAELNLAISPEKSGVRDASKGTPFLGYHVCAFTLRTAGSMAVRKRDGSKTVTVRRRPTRGNIKLWVPRERVYRFCRDKKLGDIGRRNGKSRPQFLDSSEAEIIIAFNSELRGLANYYAIADGVKSSLDPLELVMFRSLLSTIADMRRTTVPKVLRKLKMGADYGVTTVVRGQPRVHLLWRIKHLRIKAWPHPAVDNITVGSRLAQSPNDFAVRLRAAVCESCGTTEGPFEMHHPHRLKDKRGEAMTLWKQAARRRQTIVLCRKCHKQVHGGLKESKMESRVH